MKMVHSEGTCHFPLNVGAFYFFDAIAIVRIYIYIYTQETFDSLVFQGRDSHG